MAFQFIPMPGEAFIQRVCRESREHDAYIVAHPEEFSIDQVSHAKNSIHDSEMLEVRDILRYS